MAERRIFLLLLDSRMSNTGSRKKVIFFSGPATKALHPGHLELSGHILFGIYFRAFKKVLIS